MRWVGQGEVAGRLLGGMILHEVEPLKKGIMWPFMFQERHPCCKKKHLNAYLYTEALI